MQNGNKGRTRCIQAFVGSLVILGSMMRMSASEETPGGAREAVTQAPQIDVSVDHVGNEISVADLDGQIAPIPQVQEQLGRAVDAFARIDNDYRGIDEAYRQLRKARNLADWNDFIQQWALFVAKAEEEGDEVRYGFAFALPGAIEFPEPSVVEALVPYLDTTNPHLRDAIEDTLGNLDPEECLPSDSIYNNYVYLRRRNGEPIPSAFARYLFWKDPTRAFQIFLASEEGPPTANARSRALLWAEHVVSDALWKKQHKFDEAWSEVEASAKEQLQKLSNRKEWWVRLYVAGIITRYPELDSPDLRSRLEQDAEAIIRRFLQEHDGRP